MLKQVLNVIKDTTIRNKILVTLFVVAIYRLLAVVPLPGIDMAVYTQEFSNKSTSEASFLLTLFTGGQLNTPSIVGLGIGVYISASIVMQLLTTIIPKLEELSKDGARGRQIIDQYTRYLALPMSIIYSLGLIFLLNSQPLQGSDGASLYLIPRMADGTISPLKIALITLCLTGGAMLVMWLAELITEKGIGNGSSIILAVGLLASLPAYLGKDLSTLNPAAAVNQALQGDLAALVSPSMIAIYLLIFGALLIVMGVVYVTESTRKITVQYARRERTGNVQDSFLPLKLNQSGVLPIIFASSLLTTPQLVIPLLKSVLDSSSPLYEALNSILQSPWLALNGVRTVQYAILYFILIMFFSVFYSFIALRPDQLAENLQKSGGFIPGIRPGTPTEDYITKVMLRLSFLGSFFLGFLALIPILAGGVLQQLNNNQSLVIFSAIGGTSVLIIVGVVLETIRQIAALRSTQDYESYV